MTDSELPSLGAGVSPSPRPVVIDTDPGVDDAQAISMMLSADRRGEIRVLGLTVTFGNSTIKQCTRNARRTLAVLGRLDIPIYAGAHCGLVSGKMGTEVPFHGNNGLGDAIFEEPLPSIKQQEEHAVWALIRLAREHKGELSILALGPLTNIAIATRMDPEFTNNIKDLYVMGGNYAGMDNKIAYPEFNFESDPEAANIVLATTRMPITIATWELCFNHMLDTQWRTELLGAADSAAARFFNKVEANILNEAKHGGWVPCDQLAAAVLLRPQVVLNTNTHHATVELQGEYTRGQMVVDKRGWHAPMESTLNVNIVETLDMDLYKKMLLDAFGHPDINF